MKNFPYRDMHLLPVDRFISYCKDRGVVINRKKLEQYHRLGLLYPCVRFSPGLLGPIIAVKIKGKKEYIDKKSLKEYPGAVRIGKSFSYLHAPFSYGGDDWIKNYEVELPVEDKQFREWFFYKRIHGSASRARMSKHRILLYDKRQLFLLKYVIDHRTTKFSAESKISEKQLEIMNRMVADSLKSFDENFESARKDFLKFFRYINKIESLWHRGYKKIVKRLQPLVKASSNSNMGKKNKTFNYGVDFDAMKKNMEMKGGLFSNGAKSLSFNCKFLERMRVLLSQMAFPNSSKLSNYLIVDAKDRSSEFAKRGELLFMSEVIGIVKKIEWYFDLVHYDNFVKLEKRCFGRDNLKMCKYCGNSFIKTGRAHNAETCSPECGAAYKKKNKNRNRRKT